MKSIIRFSMKNTVALCIVIILMIGGGIYSATTMKMEKYPDIDIPYLYVRIAYPGASPEQVMRDIGSKLESEIKNIEGVNNVYSWGYPNFLTIMVKADMSFHVDEIEEEMRNIVSKADLPEEASEPFYSRETLDIEIYQVAFSGTDQEKVQSFVQDEVVPTIKSINGVDQVIIRGALEKNIYIQARPDDLKEKGLTLHQLEQSILSQNVTFPIGEIKSTEKVFPIRINDKLESLNDIKKIQIPIHTSETVLQNDSIESIPLSEVADITYEAKDGSI